MVDGLRQELTSAMSEYGLIGAAVLSAGLLGAYALRNKTPYPPGPEETLPFLGVATKHPRTEFWRTYAEWGRIYGPSGIISFQVLGRRFVVLNTAKAAEEMLEKQSATFSDRPFPMMSGVLMRREKSIFLMKYGERLKTYRKLMHQDFNPTAAQAYWSVQEEEAVRLAASLLKQYDADLLERYLRKNAAAVIMRIAYGIQVEDLDNRFVKMAQESMRVASLASAPGKWLVDAFPILRYIPKWFPGANFRRLADEWAEALYVQSLIPVKFVKDQLASGTALPSFSSRHLQPPASEEEEDNVLWTAGALYSGAADTIQRRAQEEIDRVVGTERLPKTEDMPRLPFVNNIITEVLRWAPPSPMGMPHSSMSQDATFDGYFIPKNSTIFANIWAILRDESVYPEPDKFDPDRYDGSRGQPDARRWVFGFGRRVCPGMHIAEASVFIQVAMTLAVFDILQDVDKHGQSIVPVPEYTTAIVTYPKAFPFKLRPRSPAAVSLVQNAVASIDRT